MINEGVKSWLRVSLACAATTVACTDGSNQTSVQASAPALAASDDCESQASADLRNAEGTSVGTITFKSDGESTVVVVSAALEGDHAGIHGLHVHANDVPDNGEGCIADPGQPASSWFVSVDGHYNPGGASHGHHSGDMPALFFSEAGDAWAQFLTDRFQPDALRGKAVILHASSDNYGNIPVGDGDDQYTPNSDAASEATAKTGNAGARIACGVIE